jgi:hypothetical protein
MARRIATVKIVLLLAVAAATPDWVVTARHPGCHSTARSPYSRHHAGEEEGWSEAQEEEVRRPDQAHEAGPVPWPRPLKMSDLDRHLSLGVLEGCQKAIFVSAKGVDCLVERPVGAVFNGIQEGIR